MAKESTARVLFRQAGIVVAGYVALMAAVVLGTAVVTGDWHLGGHLARVVRYQLASVGAIEPEKAAPREPALPGPLPPLPPPGGPPRGWFTDPPPPLPAVPFLRSGSRWVGTLQRPGDTADATLKITRRDGDAFAGEVEFTWQRERRAAVVAFDNGRVAGDRISFETARAVLGTAFVGTRYDGRATSPEELTGTWSHRTGDGTFRFRHAP